jgi:uncharacterized membrane protein
MTFFADIAILLDIPILREIVVFVFLSFVPGFAILRLFKLKEISFLDTILFSVGLSIAFVMFLGLLVNELYLFLGLSQPLSTVPLTVAISAFTLTVFFIENRSNSSETLKVKTSFEGQLKNVLPLFIILFLLPLLSALGVVFLNVSVLLLSCALIAALCVMSVVYRRLVPENLFPLLIFLISIALVCQVLLTSKYITGWDANLEYYVFRLTQLNGHWGFLNANVNSLVTLNYNSMLSITLLPVFYSALTGGQGEIVFKTLYPFIFCLVPLTLYRICEKQFGKLIGLLSALFFVFTSVAFYGPEIVDLNRQIVGEFFFILSVFLLISKTIPVTKRRLLLMVFGAALVVSHYALAYIYLLIVAIVFVISRVKPRFDDALNNVTVLFLFVITFLWYNLTNAPLTSFISTIKGSFIELTSPSAAAAGLASSPAGSASAMFGLPQVFTVASWINLLVSGIANLFLIIGVLAIILKLNGKGISPQFKVILTLVAAILGLSFIFSSIAIILAFGRLYGIFLLFLSPCFIFGGQTLLATIGKVWTQIKRVLKRHIVSKSKNIDLVLLLIAIILGGYFLSQVGFVNRVTNSGIHSYSIDFDKIITSNVSSSKIILYDDYIPEQDVYSASWLLDHKVETTEVFADYLSEYHVLLSYGLIPNNLLLPLTNTTIPPQGTFIYLGSLNTVTGVITTTATTTGSFNTSEISSLLNQNNLVYSNGNSEIWYVAPAS